MASSSFLPPRKGKRLRWRSDEDEDEDDARLFCECEREREREFAGFRLPPSLGCDPEEEEAAPELKGKGEEESRRTFGGEEREGGRGGKGKGWGGREGGGVTGVRACGITNRTL